MILGESKLFAILSSEKMSRTDPQVLRGQTRSSVYPSVLRHTTWQQAGRQTHLHTAGKAMAFLRASTEFGEWNRSARHWKEKFDCFSFFLLIDYGIVRRIPWRTPYFCRSGKKTAWKEPGKRFQDSISVAESLLPWALL